MAFDPTVTGADRRMRRARAGALVSLAVGTASALALPAIGLTREPAGPRVALGAVGLGAVAVVLAGAVYVAVTPDVRDTARRRCRVAFAVVAALSVPLAAPVAVGAWPTWAWLGASLVGAVPLVARFRAVPPVAAAVVAVAAAVATTTGTPVVRSVVVSGGIGLGLAAVNGFQVWFWDMLVQAGRGQLAQARLAAAQERLRFAGDVHDLLGHHLTVIALKAELAARLAPTDAERAGREAAEAQRLAATALAELRRTVHGYRRVDLAEQAAAVGQVLRSSGVRCTVVSPAGELPAEAAAQLAAVLREAGTNVLRHSRAGWCRIEIDQEADVARMTVTNDGARVASAPDRHSHGLRGLAERLAAVGGELRTHREDGIFTVEATVPTAS
ncbi:sensor histidine kinase [Micromonospora citrea]|nr:histidine kinase [Micromonospora citrea]